MKIEVDFEPYLKKASSALVFNCIVQNTVIARLRDEGKISDDEMNLLIQQAIDNVFTATSTGCDLHDPPPDWPTPCINRAILAIGSTRKSPV